MDAEAQSPSGKSVLDIVVGVEAGVLGGLLMLVWLALISPILGEPWWLYPNLFASTLYGESYRYGSGMITLVGSALHLLLCGTIGAVNGVITPGGRLFGIGIAAAWYLFCYLFLWKRMAPMLLTHGSQPVLMIGYFLLGSALGQHSNLLMRVYSKSHLGQVETGI